jgi:hypothetical protein
MVSMTTDADGTPTSGRADPAYPPAQAPYPAYPAPGYPPAYPPPGYQQPAHPPPGYYAPPGYTQPGYGYYPPPGPQALKPGIVALRPLTMSDIFNGAVSYIRLNPKAALGMTAIVVVIAQALALLIQIGPMTSLTALKPETFGGATAGQEFSDPAFIGLLLSSAAGGVTTSIAAIVLNGLLTVIVGRSVFGAKITAAEAWQRARGRLLPLLAFTALEVLAVAVIVGLATGLTALVYYVAGVAAAVAVGLLLLLAVVALLVWGGTLLVFAPVAIVLERASLVDAVTRSLALVRNDFWRVLGIWLLGTLVAGVIAGAVAMPFSLVGQIMMMAGGSMTGTVVAAVLITIGGAIGQIITAPFTAGVVVLLYTDRRIRAEAFDLVLQSGATDRGADSGADIDRLWLIPPRP